MKRWQRLEPTIVKKFGYRTMVTKTFRLPDGTVKDYTTKDAEGSGAACVLALTTDNKVIVAHQFRPGPERMMDELPGGMIEAGETAEQAAWRELREETGYEPGELTYLGDVRYDAYTNSSRHYFFAINCRKVAEPSLDEGEFVTLKLITSSNLLKMPRLAI
jgi:ADP-ribose pyrophosphatase